VTGVIIETTRDTDAGEVEVAYLYREVGGIPETQIIAAMLDGERIPLDDVQAHAAVDASLDRGEAWEAWREELEARAYDAAEARRDARREAWL
jgi:hypothetical protein